MFEEMSLGERRNQRGEFEVVNFSNNFVLLNDLVHLGIRINVRTSYSRVVVGIYNSCIIRISGSYESIRFIPSVFLKLSY